MVHTILRNDKKTCREKEKSCQWTRQKKNKSIRTRRQFLKLAGGALVNIGLPGIFAKLTRAEEQDVLSQLRPDGKPRIPPGQTVVKMLKDMGGQPGPDRRPDWTLAISGEVRNPFSFSWEDLMALPQIDLTCDVHCVTGWTLLDVEWAGIPVKAIADATGLQKSAGFTIFEAHAGYTSNIPLSEALKGNVILAHSFNGRPLMKEHGAPIRALVPDRYFYKSAKWLEGIKFSRTDEPGYYESGAFSNSADPWKEERFSDD